MMMKVFSIGIGIVILSSFLFFTINSRKNTLSSPSPTPKASDFAGKTFLYGFTLTPKSFNGSDFTTFFTNAKNGGNVVSWSGNSDTLRNLSSAPFVVLQLAKQYSYAPVLLFSDTNSAIVSFAQKNKPPFIGIGNEINNLSATDFNVFVSQFNSLYDQIKSVSPETKVFTVFQLEKMKGLQGGLFGKTNNTDNNQWNLLKKIDKADLIAFTTYPGLIYKSPSDIPNDYYSEITTYTNKPIAFTEVGWQSESITDWSNNQDMQSQFITTFFSDTKKLSKEFIIWSFMYDQNTKVPFNSMGLFDKDGNEKKGWKTWMSQIKG